jgi:hypothetical protein
VIANAKRSFFKSGKDRISRIGVIINDVRCDFLEESTFHKKPLPYLVGVVSK